MIIKAEINEKYIDEGELMDSLKKSIINELAGELRASISQDCIEKINKKVQDVVLEQVKEDCAKLIKNIQKESKVYIRDGYSDREFMTMEEAVTKLFNNKLENHSLQDLVNFKANEIVSDIKNRYDNNFAMMIVKNLNENKMLADGVGSMLLKESEKDNIIKKGS
jgi:hypothetical protein